MLFQNLAESSGGVCYLSPGPVQGCLEGSLKRLFHLAPTPQFYINPIALTLNQQTGRKTAPTNILLINCVKIKFYHESTLKNESNFNAAVNPALSTGLFHVEVLVSVSISVLLFVYV